MSKAKSHKILSTQALVAAMIAQATKPEAPAQAPAEAVAEVVEVQAQVEQPVAAPVVAVSQKGKIVKSSKSAKAAKVAKAKAVVKSIKGAKAAVAKAKASSVNSDKVAKPVSASGAIWAKGQGLSFEQWFSLLSRSVIVRGLEVKSPSQFEAECFAKFKKGVAAKAILKELSEAQAA